MKVKVLSLLMMLAVICVFAQDFPIRRAYKLDWQGFSIPIVEDSSDLVFWKDSALGNLDIYIQKVNQYCVNDWPVPLRIQTQAPLSELLGAVKTSDNCYIVAWLTAQDPQISLYIQKINAQGQFLWAADGILLYHGEDKITRSRLVANNTGGAYLAYSPNYDDYRIFGMNIDGNGTNLWQAGGQLLMNVPSYLNLFNAVSDGAGGIILDCRVDIEPGGMQTHLVRFDANANVVGSNPLVAYSAFPKPTYTIDACGDGNFLLSGDPWENGTAVFWKIDPLGNQVGSAASLDLNYMSQFREMDVATRPDGGFFVAWRGLDGENYKTRVGSYSSTMQEEWSCNSIPAFVQTQDYYNLSLKAGSNDKVWLTYMGKLACVSESGPLPVNPDAINYYSAYAQEPVISPRGDKVSIYWKAEANAKTSLRKQVAYESGACANQPGGAPLVEYLGGNTGGLRSIALGDRYLVLWQDYRNEGEIYYKILDHFLQPWGEPNGSPLFPGTEANLSMIDLQKINDTSVALLMIEYGDGIKARVQIIDQNGEPTLPGTGLIVKEGMPALDIKMGVRDQNIYLGTMFYGGGFYQLWGQRIANGIALWGDEGTVICLIPQNTGAYLTAMAGNHYIFTLEDYNANRHTARTILTDEFGGIAPGFGPTGVELIPPEMYDNQLCLTATLKDNFLYAYVLQPGWPQYRHFMQKIGGNGYREWGDMGVELHGVAGYLAMSDLVVDNTLSFVYRRDDENSSLVYQSITLNGELVCLPSGIVAAEREAVNEDFQLIAFDDGSRALIWADIEAQPVFSWGGFDILYRYISPEGNLLGSIGLLCNAPYDQRWISAASLGTGALVTWGDDRAGVYNEDYAYTSIYGRGIAMGSVATDDQELPGVPRIALGQNYPNPFNPTTTISFSLPSASGVSLDIYNIRGQLVKSLLREEAMPAGRSELVWDGRDASGTAVSSGIYLYKLRAGEHILVRKMLLSK